MWKANLVVGAAALALLSGCLSASITTPPATDLELPNVLTLLDKKGFRIDQPVDVVLIGFEAGTAAKLQEKLQPEEVYGQPLDFIVNFPPTVEGATDDQLGEPLPAIPRAVYKVHEAPQTFAHGLFEHVLANPAEGAGANVYDANAAEDYLATYVPTELGYTWDASRPAFVLLHAHGHLAKDHGWRFTFTNGYLEPVRTFGERYPFVVYDVSARPDPFAANSANARPHDYAVDVAASGDGTVQLLHDLTIDATHYRLLQPAIYKVSTKPCHHVTLLMGVHTTSVTELAAYGRRPADLVDVAAIQSSFVNLTGDDVHVELKTLQLPQDDPALDALMRTGGVGVGFTYPFLDTMRWYLDMNWQNYVDIMDGCEEYLSLMIFGDAATRADFGGIGMYDVKYDRRISFSVWPDLSRLRSTWDGPAEQYLRTGSPTDDPWNRLNLLFAHETGHLFGQHHPQHLQHAEEPSPSVDTFQSVWSVMSYQTGMRLHDFGDVDTTNWQRNRAGYTIQEAQIAGLDAKPEFLSAADALRQYRWTEAHVALEGLIHGDGATHDHYHAGESHAHPHYLEIFRDA